MSAEIIPEQGSVAPGELSDLSVKRSRPIMETARMRVRDILQRVEALFVRSAGHEFRLDNSDDVLELAHLVNFDDEVNASRVYPNGSVAEHMNPVQLQRYDIAHGFLLKYLSGNAAIFPALSREDRQETVEGLLGQMYYNTPMRHYLRRANMLERQIAKGNAVAIEGFLDSFQETLQTIYRRVYNPDRSAGERQIVRASFSDAFANILVVTPLFYRLDIGAEGGGGVKRTLPEMAAYLRRPRRGKSFYR